MTALLDILSLAPVIPVLSIADAHDAVHIARALSTGGLSVIEVTLRTPAALDAIRRIAAELPDVVVGAGTILTPADATAAANAGARFLVSPGATPRLLDAAGATGLPFLPGASTASEMMRLMELDFGCLKFFPAEPAGGVAFLKAIAAPMPAIRFCPTGGIGRETAPSYLALPNVVCVGGSWIVPSDAIAEQQWERIATLARDATGLRPSR